MMRALTALILAATAPLLAQSAPQSNSGSSSYSISGIVVNAITGSPLDRAEVTLSTP
jgi:hypothetical protein